MTAKDIPWQGDHRDEQVAAETPADITFISLLINVLTGPISEHQPAPHYGCDIEYDTKHSLVGISKRYAEGNERLLYSIILQTNSQVAFSSYSWFTFQQAQGPP